MKMSDMIADTDEELTTVQRRTGDRARRQPADDESERRAEGVE
jgi:hypothetical protein